MDSIKILGSGAYLPTLTVDNDELSRLVDTDDAWITSRTGIKSRHISQGETAWQMGLSAAQQALIKANLSGRDIQAIIGVTCSPDYYYPSLSCIISKQIDAKSPLTIDINCACSGFIYGLDLARRYLMDNDIHHVLIVSSEVLSKQVDYTDRTTCILFGDGSAAMVLSKGDGLFSSYLKSESDMMEKLFSRTHEVSNPWVNATINDGLCGDKKAPYIFMDGQEVYKFAVQAVPDAVSSVCKKINLSVGALDYIILHQANLRIIESIAKSLDFPMSRMLHNIETCGNTSSASIPICLHEQLINGTIKKGDVIGMSGFGAGLTYASCVLDIL